MMVVSVSCPIVGRTTLLWPGGWDLWDLRVFERSFASGKILSLEKKQKKGSNFFKSPHLLWLDNREISIYFVHFC